MVNLNQPEAPSSTYFIQECTISTTTTDSSGQGRAYFAEEMPALVEPAGPAFALMEDANGVCSTTDDNNEVEAGAGGGNDELELSESEEEEEKDDIDPQYDIIEVPSFRFVLPPTPPTADNDL